MGRDVVPDGLVRANVDAPIVIAAPDALAGLSDRIDLAKQTKR